MGRSGSIFNPKVCTSPHASTSNLKACGKKVCDTEFNRKWDDSFQPLISNDGDDSGWGSSDEGIMKFPQKFVQIYWKM